MRKKFICVFLIILLFVSCFSIACTSKTNGAYNIPKTGEASIVFPHEFERGFASEAYHYRVNPEYCGKTINFRDYVTVNEETTWVLSRQKNGLSPIEDFSPILKSGENIFYVTCSDRIGISNSYRISIHVKRIVRICYYIDFDDDAFEEYTSKLTVFVPDQRRFFWKEIINHSELGNSKFLEMTEGIEFDGDVAPTTPPQKEGFTFDGWKVPTVPTYYSEEYVEATYPDGIYLYRLHIAKWK